MVVFSPESLIPGRLVPSFAVGFGVAVLWGGEVPALEPEYDYGRDIVPLLERVCFDCHGPEKQKGEIRFDELDPDFLRGGHADTWHDSLDQIQLGEMPPPKAEKQLTEQERKAITGWIRESLDGLVEATRNAGGRISSRRLARYEYANTMRDLLGVDMDFARELPPEPASPEGFLNNGRSMEISPTQIETYLSVARRALDLAIVSGERPEVFRVEQEKTAVGKLPDRRDGGAIPVNPEFLLDVEKFPRAGEFEIRITAGAVIPDGKGIPRMEVWMGCVPGIVHVPRKRVGSVDVPASADNPATFVFRGRMEDFPQAGERRFGANVSFNGVIVMLDFLDADGNELRYPHRRYVVPPAKPKKGEKAKPPPAAPEGPLLDIVVKSVSFEAPLITAWPPESHRRLIPASAEGRPDRDRAAEALRSFLPRAFRRKIGEGEIDPYLGLFDRVRADTESFEEAIREVYAAVLVSPHFLHLVDTRDAFAVANRLSYLLWSTAPDERLFRFASEGKLNDPAILAGEVERLMNDPRCAEFIGRFSAQWFDLDGLDRVAVNPEFFPEFPDSLKEAMRTETREVFGEILRGDLSALELIDSNWTVVNRTLANHYGLANRPPSQRFERVVLTPADGRGGVLGHGSFLLSGSNGEASHPIKRAVWILDRLLDTPPAPPPPDVPELDPGSSELAGLTVKEQLELHRKKESCRSCHEGIDPWGVALEQYDATGIFRTHAATRVGKKGRREPGPLLDPATELPDGTDLSSADDLKAYLLEHRRPHFARSVVRRLASYALGRSLDLGDRKTVEALTRSFQENGFRMRALIVDLVTSDLFVQAGVDPSLP